MNTTNHCNYCDFTTPSSLADKNPTRYCGLCRRPINQLVSPRNTPFVPSAPPRKSGFPLSTKLSYHAGLEKRTRVAVSAFRKTINLSSALALVD